MNPDTAAILGTIREALTAATLSLRTNPGPAAQHSLLVAPADLVDVLRLLRDQHGFDLLTNLTGIDWPDPAKADAVAKPAENDVNEIDTITQLSTAPAAGFLEVVYHLYSTTRRLGPLVLRCRTADRSEHAELPSVTAVHRGAEFQEREIFDLFGIRFTGHPDLRRILMWDEFADHPMRKDYTAPDDHEYEPTPHDAVLEKAKLHYPAAG